MKAIIAQDGSVGVAKRARNGNTTPPKRWHQMWHPMAWLPTQLQALLGNRTAAHLRRSQTYAATQKSIENLDRSSTDYNKKTKCKKTKNNKNNNEKNKINVTYSSERISSELTLYRPLENEPNEPRRLVLFFAWLTARGRHISKFVTLMTAAATDVLVVRLVPVKLLHPETGTQASAERVCTYLRNNQNYDKFLVFACSGGAYMFCEVAMKLQKEPELRDSVLGRVVGQIYDSPVDFTHFTTGIAHSITSSPAAQNVVETLVEWLLKVRHRAMTRHLVKAADFMHKGPVFAPNLTIFSNSDPMSPLDSNQIIARKWQARGMKVRHSIYEHPDTGHCVNFIRYPRRYKEDVYSFCAVVGFIEPARAEQLLASEQGS
ncbi:uncharacterized protein LOC108665793 isoform X2 [Hyalella azteca]|uniref:Uncharacterized protein LOC108665793 isoform X2 n=1 Tax=Hyalella azteca TaxID=294128 RepID=A0A8B7N2M7_HYAAZ|nr:uncharacterized protein LOC108665793 isoform X2 [Hyalella azteca]